MVERIKRLSNVGCFVLSKTYTCKGGIALVGERVSDRRGVPTKGEEGELLEPRAAEVWRRGLRPPSRARALSSAARVGTVFSIPLAVPDRAPASGMRSIGPCRFW
jgi:hypothetical protein